MSMQIFEWKDFEKREFLVNSFNLDSPYRFPMHSHRNHWELVFCEEGQFHHEVNGRIYNHEAGKIMFIRENDRHLLKGRDFRYSNIAFSGAWMDALRNLAGNKIIDSLSDPGRTPPFVKVSSLDKLDLERQIKSLRGTVRDNRSSLRFSRFLLYVVDSILLKIDDELEEDMPGWLRDLVSSVREDERLPSVDGIVKRSFRCAEHVSRSFKKYIGKTPSAFLKDLRLDRASELLLSTNYPVKEICFLCSYENPNYFHRQFRERYGLTPLEYRRNLGRRIH